MSIEYCRSGTAPLALLAILGAGACAGSAENGSATAPVGYRVLTDDGRIEIPFDVYRGDIRMAAEVNGRDVRMLIDNGILWDALLFFGSPNVDALGLMYDGEAEVGGSGDGPSLESRTASGVTLRFADIEFRDQTAVVTPYDPLTPNMWEGAEGQVSAAFFKNFVVDVDFDDLMISLVEPEHFRYEGDGVELPMTEQASGMWSIPATLEFADGSSAMVDLAIDLGNSNPLQISTGGAHGFGAPDRSIEASLGFGIQGEVLGRYGPVSRVFLGDIAVPEVATAFDAGNDFEETMIGFGLLSRFNLTFDYPQRRLFLAPNSHIADAFEIFVDGVALRTATNGGSEVARLSPRSSPAEAMLREGDRIVEVAGEDVRQHDLWDLLAHLDSVGAEVALVAERGDETIPLELRVEPARYLVDSARFVPVLEDP